MLQETKKPEIAVRVCQTVLFVKRLLQWIGIQPGPDQSM